MTTQSDKARVWLARHGIAGTPVAAGNGELRSPLLRQDETDETASQDDWATDAQRWYLQRAQGVDVAQLLPYHQTAGK